MGGNMQGQKEEDEERRVEENEEPVLADDFRVAKSATNNGDGQPELYSNRELRTLIYCSFQLFL
jgi:hypothetical protein